MKDIIIFLENNIVKILIPCTTELSLLKIGIKDVPKDVPFWIIKTTDLPTTPQETWQLESMGKPSGIGEAI